MLNLVQPDPIEALIAAFHDHTPEGPSFTNCGPVDYIPSRDFPACRRAVEALVSLGAPVIPRMRELLGLPHSIEPYFAAEVLGRLNVQDAIPDLEALILSQASVSRRVNFDQFIEYAIHDQACDALHRMNPERAIALLTRIAESRTHGSAWARSRLANSLGSKA